MIYTFDSSKHFIPYIFFFNLNFRNAEETSADGKVRRQLTPVCHAVIRSEDIGCFTIITIILVKFINKGFHTFVDQCNMLQIGPAI